MLADRKWSPSTLHGAHEQNGPPPLEMPTKALSRKHQFKTEMDEIAVAAMFPHMNEKVA